MLRDAAVTHAAHPVNFRGMSAHVARASSAWSWRYSWRPEIGQKLYPPSKITSFQPDDPAEIRSNRCARSRGLEEETRRDRCFDSLLVLVGRDHVIQAEAVDPLVEEISNGSESHESGEL